MVDLHRAAPDFPGDLLWLNTDRTPSLHDQLAGHVVVLHFWNPGNVHCLHVLATLRFLEQQFRTRPFAVVGVLAPRVPADREPERARAALHRHGVRHATVLDGELRVWQDFVVRAWPSIVIVDSTGNLRFQGAGAPDRQRLSFAVESLLREGSREGTLASAPFAPKPEPFAPPPEGLCFPSGLAVDAARGWLWIADTMHHRVVAADLASGEVTLVIGSGAPGANDGRGEQARFCEPRGLCVGEHRLWVADTGNHLVRQVSLTDHEVVTVLGQGRPVRDQHGGTSGSDQGLCSPFGLCLDGETLYFTNAGTNQIWSLDPDSGAALAFAGSGHGSLVDGTRDLACLAQPRGLSLHGRKLAFADSETSAVRVVDLDAGTVTTLAGEGLFAFGDVDGVLPDARLQHPLDVAWHGDDLLVADTLNDKVKRIHDGTITTLLGPLPDLRRPSSLAVHGDSLFVASTDAHAVLQVDLRDGRVTRFTLDGLTPPAATRTLRTRRVTLRALSDATLRVPFTLPPGARAHPDVPPRATCENVEGHPLLVEMTIEPDVGAEHVVVRGLPMTEDGEGVLRLRLELLTCHDQDAVCHLQRLERLVPVSLVPEAKGDEVLEDESPQ